MQRADRLVIAVASLGCPFALGGCSLLFVESAADEVDVDAALDVESDAAQESRACAGTLVSFEGLPGNNARLGQHEGLDFGETWGTYSAGQFNTPSASIAFATDRGSGEFGLTTGSFSSTISATPLLEGVAAPPSLLDPEGVLVAGVVDLERGWALVVGVHAALFAGTKLLLEPG